MTMSVNMKAEDKVKDLKNKINQLLFSHDDLIIINYNSKNGKIIARYQDD